MILIVDSQEDARYLLYRMLKLDGYSVTAAENGMTAWSLLQTLKPSLIITELDMPGMNGLELLRAVRADAGLEAVPVIIFSADDEARPATLGMGVDAFVVKGTMDWVELQREVLRLAGPGTEEKTRPNAGPTPQRDAG